MNVDSIALELATNVINSRKSIRYQITDEDGVQQKVKRDYLVLDLREPFDQCLKVYDSEDLELDWLTEMYRKRLLDIA